MKKYILLSVAIGLTCIAQGQFLCTYKLLNQPYLKGIAIRPNAQLQVYSEPSGGELLGNTFVGADGSISEPVNLPKIGFMLDRKTDNNTGGTNLVQNLIQDLFDCKTIQVNSPSVTVEIANKTPMKIELVNSSGIVLDVKTISRATNSRNIILNNNNEADCTLKFKRLNGTVIAEQNLSAFTSQISFNSGSRKLKISPLFRSFPVSIVNTSGSLLKIQESQFTNGFYEIEGIFPGVYIASSADKKQSVKFVVTQ
jgi:hypothetical protein